MKTTVRFFPFKRVISLLLLLLAYPVVSVAEKADVVPNVSVTLEELANKIIETRNSTELGDEEKSSLLELYTQSKANLEKAQSHAAEAEVFSQASLEAPAQASKLKKQLNDKTSTEALVSLKRETKDEQEQLLRQKKTSLVTAEANLEEIKKEIRFQSDRPVLIKERLVELAAEKKAVAQKEKQLLATTEDTRISEARRWEIETRKYALSAESRRLELELLSHQVRSDLLSVRKATIQHQVEQLEKEISYLEEMLGQRRVIEAEKVKQEVEATREEVKTKHPVLRQMAESNAMLAEAIAHSAKQLESIIAQEDIIRAEARRVENELDSLQQKIQVAGLNQTLGRVLVEYRRTLPDLSKVKSESADIELAIADASLKLIQYNEEQSLLHDKQAYIDKYFPAASIPDLATFDSEFEDLLTDRRGVIGTAIASERDYLRALEELDLAYRQYLNTVQEYQAYLNKRLLWIRSTAPIGLETIQQLPDEIQQLISPGNWLDLIDDYLNRLQNKPGRVLALLVFVMLAVFRKRFLYMVAETGATVGRISKDNFNLTWQGLLWTALAAAPVPMIFYVLGDTLKEVHDAAEFSLAVANAFQYISLDFLFLVFFIELSAPKGVLAAHFRWHPEAVQVLRKQLKILSVVFLPAAFIAVHNIYLDRGGFGGALSMIAVLVAIGSIGYFVYRLFTPSGGVLAGYIESNPEGMLSRLRVVWLGLLLAYITGLLVLVMIGYLYTGGVLTRDLINTLWLFFFIVLARGLVIRWLLLMQRRLALKSRMLQRDKAREKRRQEKDERAESAEDLVPDIDDPGAELVGLDIESRKLINTAVFSSIVIGLWFIWSSKLPALSILDDVTLWSYSIAIDGIDKLTPVTLADLALAIIVTIITLAAARGLPAFLEFILLQRTSVTAGMRYTATTLMKYVIYGVGIVLFFNLLGGQWSQIQWLVAALGVGIGFGLQEIVANFISGLIILFERPIRVGDVVTVGNTSGVVSKINIRATTITNWDRQELLVPNKEFITNQLLNWSLSDPVTRVRITVGVAYGSDVAKALMLMKEAADEHDNVLEDPEPILTFDGFGDNALNLQLRAYLPSMDYRLKTITELNQAINQKFIEAGIVIAFPQRDVHLDTSRPLDITLHHASDEKE